MKFNDQLNQNTNIASCAQVLQSEIGNWTEIGQRCRIENTEIGDYSYVQQDVDIASCSIGKFVSIAASVRINPSNHPWWRASQHHFTYRPSKYGFENKLDQQIFQWRAENKVSIGHDVWIGHGAIVMPGVSIGNGAIVGSGSVVTKDVAAWTIVVGNPAKELRPRFETSDIGERLQQLQWWNWPHRKIAEALPVFQGSVSDFLDYYEQQ